MNSCPICGEKDQSSKVSAIVRAGTSRSSTSGTTYTSGSFGSVEHFDPDTFSTSHSAVHMGGSVSRHEHSSQSRTDLARSLSLNEEDPPSPAPFIVGGVALGLFAVSLFGHAGTVYTILFVALVIWMYNAAGGQAVVGCGFFLLIGGFLFPVFFEGIDQAFLTTMYVVCPILGAAMLAYGFYARAQYEKGEPERQRRRTVWSRLYYCGRDDVVFDPRTEDHGGVHEMHRLLDRG